MFMGRNALTTLTKFSYHHVCLEIVATLFVSLKKFYAPKSTPVNVPFCLSAFQRYRGNNLLLIRRFSLFLTSTNKTDRAKIIIKNWCNTTFYGQYFSAYELDPLLTVNGCLFVRATFTHFYYYVYVYLLAKIGRSNVIIRNVRIS